MLTGNAALAVAVVALLALAVSADQVARLGQARDVLVVTVRAIVQLLVVGVVIRLIFTTPALAPVYLAVMLATASWTSSSRLRGTDGARKAAVCAIAAGAGLVAVVVFASGALPADVRDIVPFTAQVIGGAMTATTLAGLRLRDDVVTQWDVVEGYLALGARPVQAVRELARGAAGRALVPALDQTRNVGLVVLPGAFVGLLLGGASPAEAGRIQLLVLVGLLAAETVAAVVVTRLLAGALGRTKPIAAPSRRTWKRAADGVRGRS